jgi:acyl transferase domain-containing protein/3-hydroxymyristoyl/3-hydroxydecanoyl-(acyl carrier protein) dehydratase
MQFPPIAIVGRGCVLPGALTPAALWELVVSGQCALSPVPDGRWRAPAARIVPEHAPHDIGGYVTGFEGVFDPGGRDGALEGDTAARWVLHAARQALAEAGPDAPSPDRSGLILGWLALPDEVLAREVERAWHGGGPVDPRARRRYASPAGACARVLGLGAGSLALDAACASSLYALKLGCDRLHDGTADLVLAGGVSGADPLLIHAGFTALSALSRSGRSRPLHRGADGLVPSEGAALVALMRLADAVARAVPVLGVVRGIGLGNDGRGEGLLVPAESGQTRAMRLAYAGAGVPAETVTLLECHATGTVRGDAAEIRSSARVFEGARDLAIGAVKSNVGHAMTAAGAVGLLKVLAAMDNRIRPLTPGVDEPVDALSGTALRVLNENEPWDGPRRAAVSAFGFGGNNAHVVVDAADLVPAAKKGSRRRAPRSPQPPLQVAVVGVGVRAATAAGTADFTTALFTGAGVSGPCDTIPVGLDGLRLPPADLKHALARQVLVFEAAREAARGVRLPAERSQVLIATDRDPEIVRHTARLRGAAQPAPRMESAQVVGFLANMTANRISSQLDLAGASFAVGDEGGRSTDVLAPAVRAILAGEADAALVGAVDVSCPSVGDEPRDAAAVLVLKRLDHARRDGDPVMAILDPAGAVETGETDGTAEIAARATSEALLSTAAGVLALYHRARPRPGGPAKPWLAAPLQTAAADPAVGWTAQEPPRWHVFSGADRAGVLTALDHGRESRGGPARLVIVSAEGELAGRVPQARRWLLGQAPKPRWAAYRDRPLPGRIAFVYPGGAAAYSEMGAQLALVFPDLVTELVRRCPQLAQVASWVYDGRPRPGDTISRVWGAAYFAHLHTAITREVLGIAPDAALGYSSGEAAALTALGAWPDLAGLVRDLRSSPLFTRDLAGSYDAVRRAWRRAGLAGRSWRTFLVALSADRAREALADEPAVYLMADNSPQSCTFGGEPEACDRVLRRIGADRAIPLDYDLAVHAPVVDEVRAEWRALHLRPTRPVPGVGFYSCASAEEYALTDAGAADASAALAVGTVDFRGTVERAWADGARIFIEHGPSGGCAEWIGQTLGDREHLAIALDGPGASDVDALAFAVAALIAAGVEVDDARLAERFAAARGRAGGDRGRTLSIAAHPPATTPSAPTPEIMITPAPAPVPAITPEPVPIPVPARIHRAANPVLAHHALVGARHLDFLSLLRERHTDFLVQRTRVSALLAAAIPPAPAVLFDRADLEFLAVGAVSRLLGPAFAEQDGFARQTRMPAPPMLLTDRVLGIDAEPATMGTGSIRTETDVRPDSWYLDPAGRMPAGLMVEAGQADLLLISWLGADLRNRGERVYRLLGCEITFHGSPPHPGETLAFDIAVDAHAEHGGVRLFFFHYDCRVDGVTRLSVRNGQAGFFTDAELAGTGGVLWDAPPGTSGAARSFDRERIRAFADGRLADCFGPAFAAAAAHVRTPRPAAADFLLFDEVDAFDADAGYLRGELAIRPDSWFFEGHFAADPCMPGTLMLEGCLQLMAFHLTAAGHTMRRDGWRFEPVPGSTCRISCRAQVVPSSRVLSYELFVTSVQDGPYPTLTADVLCSVDGVKAFVAEGLALRLVPDWPLDEWRWRGGLAGHVETKPVARLGGDGGQLGLESLLACAQGRPGEMMGEVLAPMDDGRRLARLPGPPYHFMSRITEADERRVVAEYDVPAGSAWFWDDGDGRTMPLCVLLEVALQPCGWLALYTAGVPEAEVELLFRNLDGQGTLAAVRRGTRVLRTEVVLTDISRNGDVILDAFEVRVWADGRPVAELRSGFGFFPPASFDGQPGLAGPAAEPDEQSVACAVRPRIGPMLSRLDRITGFWPRARRMRAEKDIAPDDWYFRAHFFQDPVQPGSLGLEAMLQLVQCYLIESGTAAPDAVFEPWLDGRPTTWRYRGQVVPGDRVTTIEIEITESGPDYAVADAWLCVDGRPIYRATGLGVRVVAPRADERAEENEGAEVLDPAVEVWVADHRPTWTVPALPMMSVVDRLAAAAGRPIAGLRDIRLARWIVLDKAVRLRGRAVGARVELEQDGVVVASASVTDRSSTPPALAPLARPRAAELPYARGGVFHGPAFRYLTRLEIGANGAAGVLDASLGTVPRGRLHQGLLDATVHVIPHDELWRWSERIRPGHVGYPYRLPWMDFFDELPAAGPLSVDVRFAGFDDDVEILPAFDVQVRRGERLLLAYRLVEVVVPLGPLARLDSRERAVFLRDREHVPGAGLATFEDGVTRLRAQDLDALEWFPGTVAHLYRLPPGADRLAEVAVRDHVARRAGVHPSAVLPAAGLGSATVLGRPREHYRVALERDADGRGISVRDASSR